VHTRHALAVTPVARVVVAAASQPHSDSA
jgi:hypothetical protein